MCVCRDTLVYFSFCPHNVITSTSISTSNFHKQIKINPSFLSNMCGETCPLQRGRVTTWLVCCHTVFLFSTPPNFVLRFTALGKYKTVLLGRQVGLFLGAWAAGHSRRCKPLRQPRVCCFTQQTRN